MARRRSGDNGAPPTAAGAILQPEPMSAAPPPPPLPSEDELHAIARAFYDKVYAHPWIGQIFRHVDQARQQLKLVRFFLMSWHDPGFEAMQGEYLREEHSHVYVTPALFDLRQALLREALRERDHDEAMVRAFLAFDERWRPYVVKRSIDECTPVLPGGPILHATPPS